MNGGFFVLILLVLFLVWLFLVRPQRRRRQAQEAMIDHLRPGDEVITAGGLFAHVVRIVEEEVTVELSPGVEARVHQAGGLYRVVVGPYATRDEAKHAAERWRDGAGIEGTIKSP